jgi:hypothetical protein
MLLAPSQARLLSLHEKPGGLCPPQFQLVAEAAVVIGPTPSPFMSLGNAALATYPHNLSGMSSWVMGRASSTLLP